ncbi:MAG: alpha-L-arabinofuranosidase [Sphingobacteriaceae bacterium]|nr:alpha-L-arabinofuranosidase [Sphingobacteriaceae bacterium]
MKKDIFLNSLTALLLITAVNVRAQTFTVKANQIKAEVSPTMWGVFFEDINMGADGGIYAELVKNRSFEFFKPLMGWTLQGKRNDGDILILNREEANRANPRFLRVKVDNKAKGALGITNEGFRGMGIKSGLKYDFSVMYRQASPGVKLHLELINEKKEVIGKAELNPSGSGSDWKKQSVSFNATATEQKAKLSIWFEGSGVIDLDMVSLFPTDTWKGRPGGMRADMVQWLADLKPGFVRFPGGCIVEGHDLATRYRWKNTIGPLDEREQIINRWNFEFKHRPTPDYFQTFGLGFYEYFQLTEDIGAEPLPILNCGMACQFNTAEVVPLEQLGPYVQDALDLIEFANGDVTTKWGKVRAELGHPKPFNMKMMGVGNENYGPQYLERLKVFTKAIKAKYPDIKLISSAGLFPSGEGFDFMNAELRKMNADIIDEHSYARPDWFFENASRYDNYPRTGSKVFSGEYAAQSDRMVSVNNKNNWQTAISEAAFLTGLERNADVVVMASYAPLFAHIDGWQWTPDMIWVDNLRSYGTPNYYVQKMFSTNRGTNVVPVLLNDKSVTGQEGYYASATIDKGTKELIIKVVNNSDKSRTAEFAVEGTSLGSKGTLTSLTAGSLEAVNTLDKPADISPQQTPISLKNKKLKANLAPYSFNVIRIKMI